MKNNYVTITFVHLRRLVALLVDACPEFTFKIRVFERFRGGSASAFALVSNLHFGRLCPNYGRVCTFWGSEPAFSCQWKMPEPASGVGWLFCAVNWAIFGNHWFPKIAQINTEAGPTWGTNLSQINKSLRRQYSFNITYEGLLFPWKQGINSLPCRSGIPENRF